MFDIPKYRPLFILLAMLALPGLAVAAAPERWESFWTAEELKAHAGDADLVIVDVRSEKEYAEGHIPGAINLPGKKFRTPSSKGPEGKSSQDIYLTPEGKPDVEKYEALLSAAGIRNDHMVVVYGSHAGKADGSVPAAILQWLGHEEVAFLNGVGVERWKAAGGELTTEPRTLPASEYEASPAGDQVWDLEQVLAHLGDADVVFFDTRSPAEFSGEDKRDNRRGGRIPGAVLLNYEDMMTDDTKEVIAPAELQAKLDEAGIAKDKTVVLYCQTATRTSLPQIALRDLGYENVVVYDASWHEYGNRDDTPVETPDGKVTPPVKKAE